MFVKIEQFAVGVSIVPDCGVCCRVVCFQQEELQRRTINSDDSSNSQAVSVIIYRYNLSKAIVSVVKQVLLQCNFMLLCKSVAMQMNYFLQRFSSIHLNFVSKQYHK